jgi:hypothetical protein
MVTASPVRKRRAWRTKVARNLMEATGNPLSMTKAVSRVGEELLEGVQCPPTDLDAVAAKVSILACIAEDMAGSGQLRRDDVGLTIAYSRFLSKPRRRFTIAHEIAHAYLETRWRGLSRPSNEVELLCNMIAAEVLMPQARVINHLRHSRLKLDRIFEIAQVFQVSLSAAAIRCAELRSATVFEVEGANVSWSSGIVRKGKVQRLSEDLQSVIRVALQGEKGEDQVFFDGQTGLWPWHVEYSSIVKGRTLFLLQPLENRREARSETARA